jgi:precorrin-2 dehydrogenase / sirohydrochlorin ferrochelatase
MGYMVNLSLAGRPAVVVGAGTVALRKIRALLDAGADVFVVAPCAAASVEALADAGHVRLSRRPYASGDLDDAVLVIAATDDEEVNARVSADAGSRGILVNVVDRPSLCSFTLPAVLRRGSLTIAVATEGLCPTLAAKIRDEVAERYGEDYANLTEALGRLREQMIGQGWDSARVGRALAGLHLGELSDLLSCGEQRRLDAWVERWVGPGFRLPLTLGC